MILFISILGGLLLVFSFWLMLCLLEFILDILTMDLTTLFRKKERKPSKKEEQPKVKADNDKMFFFVWF